MTKTTITAPVSKGKTSSQPSSLVNRARPYSLRGQTSRSTLQITPTKPSPTKHSGNGPNSSPAPSTPSNNNRKCSVCQGIEELRSFKLNEAVQEFSSKLDSYREISKSLGDNSSDLNHAITTIKHFILHLKPSVVENYFESIESKVSAVSDNLADLSNYVTKLDAIHELIGSTNKLIHLKTSSSASGNNLLDVIDSRIQKLESICAELSNKLESFDLSPLQQYQQRFNDIIADSAHLHDPCKARNLVVPSTSATQRTPKTNTVLIIGDSNTKYANLINSPSVRLPTYLIEDIDPVKCFGYHKIWVHVGINNLKSRNCQNHNDIIRHFNHFMHKLNIIRQNCPNSKIVVSPILPTSIHALNERAIAFNRMLFAKTNWFEELNFNLFCGADGKLLKKFRCYGNGRDNIHLGAVGIQALTIKVKHALSFTDSRSYAHAVKTT